MKEVRAFFESGDSGRVYMGQSKRKNNNKCIQNPVKHLKWLQTVNYFFKNLYLRCLTEFLIHL